LAIDLGPVHVIAGIERLLAAGVFGVEIEGAPHITPPDVPVRFDQPAVAVPFVFMFGPGGQPAIGPIGVEGGDPGGKVIGRPSGCIVS
jgi:hypothetical protein